MNKYFLIIICSLLIAATSCLRKEKYAGTEIKVNENIVHVFEFDTTKVIYQNYDGEVVSYNISKQKENWRFINDGQYSTSFYTDSEKSEYYYRTGGGKFGETIIALDSLGKVISKYSSWDFGGVYGKFGIMKLDSGLLVNGSNGLFCIDFNTDSIASIFRCSNPCNLSVYNFNNYLVVNDGSGEHAYNNIKDSIFFYSKKDFKLIKSISVDGQITETSDMNINNENIFFISKIRSSTENRVVYTLNCLDSLNEYSWKKEINESTLYYFSSNDELLFMSDDKNIFCFNSKSGKIKWEIESQFGTEIFLTKKYLLAKNKDGIQLINPNTGVLIEMISTTVNSGLYIFGDYLVYGGGESIFYIRI